MQERNRTEQKRQELQSSYKIQMQKERIIQKLKERKYRITRQRLLLLDIVLTKEYSCCKEIYEKASETNAGIGIATVYRLVSTLEEIGAISKNNRYTIVCQESRNQENVCMIQLDDHTVYHLSAKKWHAIISEGMKACGYLGQQRIEAILVKENQPDEPFFLSETGR